MIFLEKEITMQNKKLTIIFAILTILWMGLIFILSATPATKSAQESKAVVRSVVVSTSKDSKDIDPLVDNLNKPFRKMAHASVYLVLSILVSCLLWSLKKYKLYINNIINILWCFLYACSDEFHQTFVVGRSGELTDILIDTFGAIIGILLFGVVYKIVINRNKEKVC